MVYISEYILYGKGSRSKFGLHAPALKSLALAGSRGRTGSDCRLNWFMDSSPIHARAPHRSTLLIAGAALLALGPGAKEVESHLPFELLPGVACLGLLAGPFLWRTSDGPDWAPDLQFAAYGGPAHTMRSNLTLAQPNGTHLQFKDIPWKGKPFTAPPYYGLRGIYWLPDSRLGVMGDFTHIKAEAVRDSVVVQSGVRDGAPVGPHEPLSATFNALEFSHGFNLMTLNLVRRGTWHPGGWVAYVGAGVGVAFPHVEVQRSTTPSQSRTYEYQIAGPAVQVLGGIEWRLSQRLSLFVEYKLSCAAISGALVDGGSIETNLCTHQLLGGSALHLTSR